MSAAAGLCQSLLLLRLCPPQLVTNADGLLQLLLCNSNLCMLLLARFSCCHPCSLQLLKADCCWFGYCCCDLPVATAAAPRQLLAAAAAAAAVPHQLLLVWPPPSLPGAAGLKQLLLLPLPTTADECCCPRASAAADFAHYHILHQLHRRLASTCTAARHAGTQPL
jgi:hypothetical protein